MAQFWSITINLVYLFQGCFAMLVSGKLFVHVSNSIWSIFYYADWFIAITGVSFMGSYQEPKSINNSIWWWQYYHQVWSQFLADMHIRWCSSKLFFLSSTDFILWNLCTEKNFRYLWWNLWQNLLWDQFLACYTIKNTCSLQYAIFSNSLHWGKSNPLVTFCVMTHKKNVWYSCLCQISLGQLTSAITFTAS